MDKDFEYKVVKSLIRNSINTNHLIQNLIDRVNTRTGQTTPPCFNVSNDDIIHSFASDFNLDYEKLKTMKLRNFK